MTSRYPSDLRLHGHLATHEQNAARGMVGWLDPQVPTVARFLRDVGYATCPIGNGHLGGGQGAPTPDAYGFDVYRSTTGAGETWNEGQDPTFRARSTALFVDEAREVHRGQPRPAVLPEPPDPSAARAPQPHRAADGAIQAVSCLRQTAVPHPGTATLARQAYRGLTAAPALARVRLVPWPAAAHSE